MMRLSEAEHEANFNTTARKRPVDLTIADEHSSL
jgi:hypothetical protein